MTRDQYNPAASQEHRLETADRFLRSVQAAVLHASQEPVDIRSLASRTFVPQLFGDDAAMHDFSLTLPPVVVVMAQDGPENPESVHIFLKGSYNLSFEVRGNNRRTIALTQLPPVMFDWNKKTVYLEKSPTQKIPIGRQEDGKIGAVLAVQGRRNPSNLTILGILLDTDWRDAIDENGRVVGAAGKRTTEDINTEAKVIAGLSEDAKSLASGIRNNPLKALGTALQRIRTFREGNIAGSERRLGYIQNNRGEKQSVEIIIPGTRTIQLSVEVNQQSAARVMELFTNGITDIVELRDAFAMDTKALSQIHVEFTIKDFGTSQIANIIATAGRINRSTLREEAMFNGRQARLSPEIFAAFLDLLHNDSSANSTHPHSYQRYYDTDDYSGNEGNPQLSTRAARKAVARRYMQELQNAALKRMSFSQPLSPPTTVFDAKPPHSRFDNSRDRRAARTKQKTAEKKRDSKNTRRK